jgi:hypothetical protein
VFHFPKSSTELIETSVLPQSQVSDSQKIIIIILLFYILLVLLRVKDKGVPVSKCHVMDGYRVVKVKRHTF